MRPQVARIVLRTVGVIVLLCAGLGILYTFGSAVAMLNGGMEGIDLGRPVPDITPAFFTMSAICVACYIGLMWCGIQFVRLSASLWWLFALLSIIEIAYFVLLGKLWVHPTYGFSIAAASGLSSGGLTFQFLILLPLWGPVLVWLANRSLRAS